MLLSIWHQMIQPVVADQTNCFSFTIMKSLLFLAILFVLIVIIIII